MEMTRQEQRNLYQDLLEQLADIERQQQDKTMSHSDQQLLDQAWEDITNQIDDLEEIFDMQNKADEADWRDALTFFEEEDETDWTPQPSVSAPARLKVKTVTFAPPPPRGAGADEPRPKSPEVLMPSEEELAELNAWEDNRAGCDHCAGCTYCFEGAGYDGTDEV